MTYPWSSGQVLTAADLNAYAGLVLVTSATATSGTTLDINNCFSSTFDSYRVVITQFNVTSGAYGLLVRMKAGATVATTGYYATVIRYDVGGAAVNYYNQNNAAQIDISCITTAGTEASASLDIHGPNRASYTGMIGQSTDSRGASGYAGIQFGGMLNNTTAYTDLRLFIAGGAFASVTAKVYGYNNG